LVLSPVLYVAGGSFSPIYHSKESNMTKKNKKTNTVQPQQSLAEPPPAPVAGEFRGPSEWTSNVLDLIQRREELAELLLKCRRDGGSRTWMLDGLYGRVQFAADDLRDALQELLAAEIVEDTKGNYSKYEPIRPDDSLGEEIPPPATPAVQTVTELMQRLSASDDLFRRLCGELVDSRVTSSDELDSVLTTRIKRNFALLEADFRVLLGDCMAAKTVADEAVSTTQKADSQ
jgi:hypothetical protein